MMNPIALFDYVFYRTYVFYQKRNDDIDWFRGVCLVSFLESLIVLEILFLVKSFVHFTLPANSKYLIGGTLIVLILALNSMRYGLMRKKNGFSVFHERWGSKDRKTVRRDGWFIVLFIIFVVFVITAVTAMVYKASGQSVPR